MEARLIGIENTFSSVLTECSKMLTYMKMFKDKAGGILNYMKLLSHSSFLREYSSMHKLLNKLNSELIEHNCQFELFFLKMQSTPKSHLANDFLFNAERDEFVASPTSAASLPLDNNNDAELECNSISDIALSDNLKVSKKEESYNNCNNFVDKMIENMKSGIGVSTDNTDITNDDSNVQEDKHEGLQLNVFVENFYQNLFKETEKNSLKDYTTTEALERPRSKISNNTDVSGYLCNSDRNEVVNLEAFVKYASVPMEEECCFVSHVESPSLIYIQIISEDSALINSISEQILEELPNLRAFSTKVEAQKYLPRYCVCYLQRSASWYRGSIENWLMSGKEDLVEVRLLDYGHLCLVHINNIREANSLIFASQIMAVKSKLAWLLPPNDLKEWPPKTNAFLKNLLLGEHDSIFFLSHVQWNSDYLLIDLKSKSTESVAAELVANNLAADSPSTEEIIKKKLARRRRN